MGRILPDLYASVCAGDCHGGHYQFHQHLERLCIPVRSAEQPGLDDTAAPVTYARLAVGHSVERAYGGLALYRAAGCDRLCLPAALLHQRTYGGGSQIDWSYISWQQRTTGIFPMALCSDDC